VEVEMKDPTVGQILRLHATVLGVLLGTAMPAFATTPPGVPEIDGASLSAGLGLLGAGVLWLRARRTSK
jgi:MYXO-CTERM domain-containing protein